MAEKKSNSNTDSTVNKNNPFVKKEFAIDFHWPTIDPFLFCAYHHDQYPSGHGHLGPDPKILVGRNLGMDFVKKDGFRMYHGAEIPGFPAHPHRGFETVTIVNKGYVDHADSLGASGRYGEGDVQWMTAGKGIQHSEMFPLLYETKDNELELFQIWLNLPSRHKMVEPHFSMFWNENIPVAQDSSATVKVIAGSYNQHLSLVPPPNSWAFAPENHVNIWLIDIKAGGSWNLPAHQSGLGRCLYFYQGDVLSMRMAEDSSGFAYGLSTAKGVQLPSDQSLTLHNPAKGNARLVLLEGRPIAEPIIQQGPFVMNSKDEILTAIKDYRATEFGGWPWERADMVHDPYSKRFALYPDGKKEKPD